MCLFSRHRWSWHLNFSTVSPSGCWLASCDILTSTPSTDLKYAALQYKDATRLFGISLEQPTRLLDEKEPLSLPSPLIDADSDEKTARGGPTSFLWQAPSSNAVLYMGEKWIDLHRFVSRSLAAQRNPDTTPALLANKLVSKKHPSWLEHALRLARLRGYYTLYPGEATAQSLATVHGELYNAPEEYAADDQGKNQQFVADDATEEEVEAARARARGELESGLALTSSSLLDSLPDGSGELRSLNRLPLLAWDGSTTDLAAVDEAAARYAALFREQVGGCPVATDVENLTTKDLLTQELFCVAR